MDPSHPSRLIVTQQARDGAKLERAKEMRREMTFEENLLWQRLRRNGLSGLHFRRQQVIEGFIVDFFCNDAGLVVEVDGPIHLDQRKSDGARDEALRQRGLWVLRFTNERVRQDMRCVLSEIEAESRRNLTLAGE